MIKYRKNDNWNSLTIRNINLFSNLKSQIKTYFKLNDIDHKKENFDIDIIDFQHTVINGEHCLIVNYAYIKK